MINQQDFEKYSATISKERLEAFVKSGDTTIDDAIDRYIENIKISQALYPELSILEVTLRNSIDAMLRTNFSEKWIEDEIQYNYFLSAYDLQTLIKAYNDTKTDCKKSNKTFTIGKVIANLNFGFWTNLCAKKYSIAIWHKRSCFRSVFVNYPAKKQEIKKLSKQLGAIRCLRNRVFHYEQIFKYPGNTLKLYNEILEVISYLPNTNPRILKETSGFLNLYNELVKNYNNKQKNL